jgi:hypothetical protein
MIIFLILYVIVWFIITYLLMILPYQAKGLEYITIIFDVSALILFLMIIFYSPWHKALQKDVDDTKKKYDKLKTDTESTYQDQIKAFWIDALNEQNRYYLFSFVVLTFLPFIYFLIYILFHTIEEIDLFLTTFPFIYFIVYLFYTSVLLLLYTIASKLWVHITIPSILLLFLGSVLHFKKQYSLVVSLGAMILCFILSFLIFSNVPFYICSIITFPFLLNTIILYTEQYSQMKSKSVGISNL